MERTHTLGGDDTLTGIFLGDIPKSNRPHEALPITAGDEPRDRWSSRWTFVLGAVGSAVGMKNKKTLPSFLLFLVVVFFDNISVLFQRIGESLALSDACLQIRGGEFFNSLCHLPLWHRPSTLAPRAHPRQTLSRWRCKGDALPALPYGPYSYHSWCP